MDRLLGKESRVKATPVEIAGDVSGIVVQEADQLMAKLRKERAPRDEAVFMGECLIFSAFPFDVIVLPSSEHTAMPSEASCESACSLFLAPQGVMDGLPMERFGEFADHLQAKGRGVTSKPGKAPKVGLAWND